MDSNLRKASVIINNETRGAPLKIVFIVLGIIVFVRGIQLLFFCGQPFPGIEADRILFETLDISDCEINLYRKGVSAICGLHAIVVGVIRFRAAFTEKVAELCFLMEYLVFVDMLYASLFIFASEAAFQAPVIVTGTTWIGLLYEIYILRKAKKAYVDRQNERRQNPPNRASVLIVEETRGVPLRIVQIILAVIAFFRGIQFYFFCGQPIPGNEADGIFFESLGFEDCKTNMVRKALSMIYGGHGILIAMIRWRIATTKHVADLHHSLFIIVINDLLFVVVYVMCWEVAMEHTRMVSLTLPIALAHEAYIFSNARRAYINREKEKVA